MQEQKYEELEERATLSAEAAIPEGMPGSLFSQLEARRQIAQELEAMREEGETFSLTDEEISMLGAFRRFKLRMKKEGEVFSWQTRRPEGVQIVSDTANILHPQEA